MSEPTLQEIMETQGTRLQKAAPWETYSQSFDEKLNAKLQAEVDAYSQKYHEKSSAQNEEELARWHEENCNLVASYRWLDPNDYADLGPRIGKIMHSSELINKLRNECKVECWYREHPHRDKITLMVRQFGEEPKMGCWVQYGFAPEYSIMGFDEHYVPTAERYRGWRTVLLQLILKGIITEEQADKYFGRATGPASERYLSTLYGFRNRRVKVVA